MTRREDMSKVRTNMQVPAIASRVRGALCAAHSRVLARAAPCCIRPPARHATADTSADPV